MPDPNEVRDDTHNANPEPAPNPRERIGGNSGGSLCLAISEETRDFAVLVTEYLEERYQQYPLQLQQLVEGAANLPRPVTSVEDKEAVVETIRLFRDLRKKLDGIHENEKQRYLRGGQGADQFFFGMIDQIAKRNPRARPGIMDALLADITDYDNRVIAAERERLRLAAVEAARVAEEARLEQKRLADKAEADRLAVERARNPVRIEERRVEASRSEQHASTAAVEATVTGQRAEQAHVNTLITTQEITRTRTQGGTLATTGTETYATLIDKLLVDKNVLWPFIPATEIEKALRAWAKTTDFNTQMPGAEIGRRNKARVR